MACGIPPCVWKIWKKSLVVNAETEVTGFRLSGDDRLQASIHTLVSAMPIPNGDEAVDFGISLFLVVSVRFVLEAVEALLPVQQLESKLRKDQSS